MYAVTTSLRVNRFLLEEAGRISRILNIPYLKRDNRNIDQVILDNNLYGVLVVGKNRLSYTDGRGEFFFHPSMSKLRITAILNGKTDQMVKALDLMPGDRVLDCTLGMASDAIVISFMNTDGEVIGIEKSPVISFIVRKGLLSYRDDSISGLNSAMRRIKVICADHREFLRNQPDNSADIVYFDPMFRLPVKKSNAISAMRPLADPSPLSGEVLQEALRVAKRRVVVKETRNSPEFSRLGIEQISGGKYSPVAYGILEKG